MNQLEGEDLLRKFLYCSDIDLRRKNIFSKVYLSVWYGQIYEAFIGRRKVLL